MTLSGCGKIKFNLMKYLEKGIHIHISKTKRCILYIYIMENISGQIQLGDPFRNRLKKLVAMTPWLQVAGPFGKSVRTVSPKG